jgi:hypothetical protein
MQVAPLTVSAPESTQHVQQAFEQPIDPQPAAATLPVAAEDGGIDSRAPLAPRISRRLTAMILGAAFVIGIAIAWTAITVGARIVGIWPFGLACYAILLGGGVTMMLTTGLLMMAFFNETADRQDRRPPTDSLEKQPPRTGDADRSSRRG